MAGICALVDACAFMAFASEYRAQANGLAISTSAMGSRQLCVSLVFAIATTEALLGVVATDHKKGLLSEPLSMEHSIVCAV